MTELIAEAWCFAGASKDEQSVGTSLNQVKNRIWSQEAGTDVPYSILPFTKEEGSIRPLFPVDEFRVEELVIVDELEFALDDPAVEA